MTEGSSAGASLLGTVLSVVVSTHNRAGKLRATLASLAACAVPPGVDWEVLVVDNSSSDDTESAVRECIAPFPARLRYLYQSTRGKSTGANLALRHVRGDLIAFLDDDVRVAPGWAAEILAAHGGDPQLDGSGGRVENLDATDPVGTRRSTLTAVLSTERVDLTCMPITGANLCFRRELLERIGGYDESLGPGAAVGGEDLDLVYRALATGGKLAYLPQALAYHDPGPRGDLELVRVRYLRGRGAFYAKHLGDRRVLKSIYHELRSCALSVLRDLAHGRVDRRSLRDLSALLGGALTYRRSRNSSRRAAPAVVRIFPPHSG